ncbi:unnamed protein product [Phytophthora fragariaefolia]|uniref:Unnamed protein product n=1 Tax=Phytophthora fragariaefolia TaxID=1490495 RepID=A0A9W7DAI2_9STRA|nr:unnamed protein product [Phytophthora fragariaefolia]
MDHIPSLQKSFKGDTELLIWIDLFTGLQPDIVTKTESHYSVPPTSQWDGRMDGADFRPFGEDVCRRHKSARLGRVRRTFHVRAQHRPGAQDRVRGDTPFYLAHGWDPRTTLEASLPFSQHPPARSRPAEVAVPVWLHLDRVKEGYARKLAHLRHGSFRVSEMVDDHAAKIEIAGSEYRLFLIVHVSKLKLVRRFPDRSQVELVSDGVDRLDFDEALLPEDSWEAMLAEDEFEVERIADVGSGRRTSYGCVHREFLVYWKAYAKPTWVDEADLNCGALLQEFERKMADRNRFHVMQPHEEGEE